MLDSLKSVKKTVGLKQSLRALESGEVKSVIIANDADQRLLVGLMDLCSRNGIEVMYVDTMKQLGKACGIDIGASVACVLK